VVTRRKTGNGATPRTGSELILKMGVARRTTESVTGFKNKFDTYGLPREGAFRRQCQCSLCELSQSR
jgi:hypothetical protein